MPAKAVGSLQDKNPEDLGRYGSVARLVDVVDSHSILTHKMQSSARQDGRGLAAWLPGWLAGWPDLCSDPRVCLLYHQNFSIPATCYLLSACPMALRQPLANSHTTLFKSSQNTEGVCISVNCHPLTPMVETGREQKSVSSGRKIIIIFIYGFYTNLLYNLR